jgi:hypothetical protein
VDPNSLNPDQNTDPDLAFQVNPVLDPIRIQIFDDQKLKKKNTAENFFIFFFISKIGIYLCPSYRRSLPSSKENIQHLKNFLWVVFALLDPDPDPGTP